MAKSAPTTGWVCTHCGAVADGDMCLSCGQTRDLAEPFSAKSGSYWRLVGYPLDPLAARFYLIYLLVPLALTVIAAIVFSIGRLF